MRQGGGMLLPFAFVCQGKSFTSRLLLLNGNTTVGFSDAFANNLADLKTNRAFQNRVGQL